MFVNRYRLIGGFLLAGFVSGVPGLAHANLLVNGSFEDGLVGWSATAPASARADEQPSDGLLSLVFDYGNLIGGAVEQTFSTTPGSTYALTFDYWGWAVATTHTLKVEVTSASEVLLSQTLTAIGSIPALHQPFSADFIATASTATLTFTDLTNTADGTNSDLSIDRVAVTETSGPAMTVPAPATGLLLLPGLVMLAWRARSSG